MSNEKIASLPAESVKTRKEVGAVTIRFAGDSGDGMQLAGSQFTSTSAIIGNDVSSLPDYPAEIRAPAGSLPGVSSFQIHFADEEIFTPGDSPDVLVAMNPAALKVHLVDVPRGSMVIVNSDEFTATNLKKAGYEGNPLENDELDGFRVCPVPMTTLNKRAVEDVGLSAKETNRSKNFFALGMTYWLYGRPLDPTLKLIEKKFSKKKSACLANQKTLRAGHAFAETTEMFGENYVVRPAPLKEGVYRNLTGNAASALGFLSASEICGRPLFYGSYPITPASDVLHDLSRYKNHGVRTFQAEDEIAAIGAAVGAAFGGALALTGTSGPGLALKGEALGMAVMTELPLVVLDVQRAGPSTGLPTRTEQGDLLQALFGRNGESPVAVIAAATPADSFYVAIEAFRIATAHMTPVVMLSDGYLANGSEPWRIPKLSDLPRFEVKYADREDFSENEEFSPYARDRTSLARPWAIPGTPGLEHRIGTLEKDYYSGNVSNDPENHHRMVTLRADKVLRIADSLPAQEVFGARQGKILVIGWGSTFGAIRTAVSRQQADGRSISHVHLRYINPLPKDLGQIISGFERVLVPENNLGQLLLLLRARYAIDAIGLNRVTGKPFTVGEIYRCLDELYDEAD